MNHSTIAFACLTSLIVVGCTSSPSKSSDITNAVTACSAGSTVKISTNLSAKIEENIKNGLNLDAGIENSLKGAFFENRQVSEKNEVDLYNKYVQCLEKRLK
ncbi:MAG: hypothetical protein AB2801_08640 [Candidatus Thiodiazotropha endolucinida]